MFVSVLKDSIWLILPQKFKKLIIKLFKLNIEIKNSTSLNKTLYKHSINSVIYCKYFTHLKI